MLRGLTQEESEQLMLSVGSHRTSRRITPVQVAELIQKATSHQDLETVASELMLSSSDMLRRFLALLNLPEPIQTQIAWGNRDGRLSFSTAYEISRIREPRDRELLARRAIELDLTKSEVQAVVQRSRRGRVTVEQALEEIEKSRPTIEHQKLVVGLMPAEIDQSENEQRRQLRRALARYIGSSHVLSVAIKSGQFAVLLRDIENLPDKEKQSLESDVIEQTIAGLLEKGC